MQYVLVIHFIISLIAYTIMGLDKLRAIKQWRRVPEKVLLSLAIFGGALGIAIGMISFRHKSSKKIFRIIIPLALVIQWMVLLLVSNGML